MSAMESNFNTSLAQFRQDHLSPDVLLDWLTAKARRKGLIDLGAGYGKSRAFQALICFLATYDRFDRVICVVDQCRVLAEYLAALDEQLPDVLRDGLVVLQPRPRDRCGDYDNEWLHLEERSCGALGRMTLCTRCPHHDDCGWLIQRDAERLQPARLILGVQDYLRFIPELLMELPDGRSTMLVVDEWRDISRPVTSTLDKSQLQLTATACSNLIQAEGFSNEQHQGLEGIHRLLHHLLNRQPLKRMPGIQGIDTLTMARIQQEGHRLHASFTNILPDVFALRHHRTRWYTKGGDVAFMAHLPVRPHTMLIASTGVPIGLLRDKLDCPDIEPVITAAPPTHPGTQIFNLRMTAGSRCNFQANMARILDFFAMLTVQELNAGRKVLLISVKQFLDICKSGMETRLETLTGTSIPIHSATDDTVPDDCQIAVIHYGISGSNAYKTFDSTFCVNSYYVSDSTLTEALADIIPGDHSYPVSIDYIDGNRVATCDSASPRIRELAGELHWLYEGLVVTQAIGRIRYNTHPRMVIVMQRGDLRMATEKEFTCLEEARSFFNVPNARNMNMKSRMDTIHQLRRNGMTQQKVAKQLGISLSTVKRRR